MRRLVQRLSTLESWQVNALGLAACAALAGLWYVAGYSPLSQARADRQGLEQELDQKRDTVAHLVKMRLAHEESLDRIRQEQARSGVPRLQPADQLLDRISAISRAAATAGLTLDEIKPGTPVVRERFTVVPIHLAGTGSFPGCELFLHTLRTTFPDTGLTGLDLRGEPEQADKPGRFVLDLAWYAARAANPPPAQTDPAAAN